MSGRPKYRDRNDHYVPEGLSSSDGIVVEIGRGQWTGEEYGPPRLAIAKLGDADELNRDKRWWWARIDQDADPVGVTEDGRPIEATEHWSHFEGHFVHVDVELHTFNEREVNDWKGRDEVRKGGTWRLRLNRLPVFSGDFLDPLEALLKIRQVIQKLVHAHHPAFHHWTQSEIDALEGRKVFFRDQPAVIVRQLISSEGRIVLEPDGIERFRPPPWAEAGDDYYDREVVTTILDESIWWWRK